MEEESEEIVEKKEETAVKEQTQGRGGVLGEIHRKREEAEEKGRIRAAEAKAEQERRQQEQFQSQLEARSLKLHIEFIQLHCDLFFSLCPRYWHICFPPYGHFVNCPSLTITIGNQNC